MELNNTSNHQKWYALLGICIASFLGCIDFTIVNTALPAIQDAFNTNVTKLQWVMNTFIMALSTFMVIMGRVADIYGRSKILYIGMGGMGIEIAIYHTKFITCNSVIVGYNSAMWFLAGIAFFAFIVITKINVKITS